MLLNTVLHNIIDSYELYNVQQVNYLVVWFVYSGETNVYAIGVHSLSGKNTCIHFVGMTQLKPYLGLLLVWLEDCQQLLLHC